MKTVFLTGVAGFIGFHFAKRLLSEGYKIIGIDNLNDYYDVSLKINRLSSVGIDASLAHDASGALDFYRLDLLDDQGMVEIFKQNKIDYLVHLAAQAGVRYSISNPKAYIDSNSSGFLNILELARNFKVKHLVYASSSSVYGLNETVPFSENHPVDHPISLYAATKRSNELMAHTYSHLYNVPTTGLRFFTVYGPWGRPDMAIFIFTKKIFAGQPIEVFNHGQMQRDFTYIDDIIEGVYRVMLKPASSGHAFNLPNTSSAPFAIYNIGRGKPLPLMDFVAAIEKNTGIKAKIEFKPLQDGDVVQTFADTTALNKAVGYTPNYSVENGVAAFVEWYKQYHKI
jgi:UDP-glucuronate 4-epimerase